MKLTKQIEAEVLDVYEAYWGSLLNVDMETYDAVLDNNFRLIGTTEAEVFFKKMEAIRFLKATADQVAGNIELRNRIIKVEPVDKLILITEESDAYVLIDDVWTFYAKTRTSALAQKKDNGWKFVQMHISFPDNRTEEGEAIALEKISKENLELRDAVKRRTVELEAKSRELEIEAALEKVRSRSLAMQQSEELMEVVAIVFEKFRELNMQADGGVGIAIFNDETKGIDYWAANPGYISATRFITPYFDHPINNDIWTARDKGTNFLTNTYSFEEKNSWWNYLLKHTDFKNLPGDNKKMILESKRMTNAIAMSKNSAVVVATYLGKSFSEEQIEIVKRFETVFDQAYTRFLDLQKAEAQAREAQIEAALERVRSRTMAMHKTDELLDAAELISKELSALGIASMNVSYAFVDEEDKNASYYSINPVDGKVLSFPFVFPHTETKVMRFILASWKKQEPFNVIELDEKATLKHQTWVGEHIQNLITKNNSGIPFSVEAFLAVSPKKAVIYTFNFKQGYLFNIGGERLTNEQEEMVLRFTKVFDMTYRRFLDLKQAEEQTREAQIELGLERVRARAMAMQKSDELKELIGTVYNELTKLDLALDRCLIWVMNSEDLSSRLWMANAESQPVNFYIPHHDNPPYLAFVKAWKDRNKRWQYDLYGQVKKEWDGYVFNHTEMKHLPDPVKKNMQATNRIMLAGSFHNFGCLQTAGPEPLKEEQFDILNRFAKVFDLTYTRFNDLQKAEAQAREAQIELGLERVRARAMAMQKSDELSELVDTVFKELTKLDFALTWCIINIIDESSMSNTVWAANPDINKPPESYHMLFEDYPFHDAMMKGWKERKTKHVYTLEGSEKKIYDDYLFSETEFKRTPEAAQAASRAMEKYVVSFSFSNFGGLQTVGDVPLSEANLDILSRFGKVFDLTYTRFNDLKQAEAQARESQIQLALERVRARTMAMQKSEELPETSHILFEQMKELGEPVEQLTIGVVQEENKVIEISATLHGDILKKIYQHSLDEPFMMSKIYHAWKTHQKTLIVELKGDELNAYNKYRNELTKSEMFPTNLGDEHRRIVYAAFFSKGMLALGANEPRPPESLQLLERFAGVFDQAYIRFIDLKNAEAQARESQLEASLERIRAKAMAMHKSEDLNSVVATVFEELGKLNLGVLRCGIGIFNKEKRTGDVWSASLSTQGTTLQISGDESFDIHPLLRGTFDAWLEQKDFSYELEGKDLNDYYEALTKTNFNLPASPSITLETKRAKQYYYTPTFKAGNLYAFSEIPFAEDAKKIMNRFAGVLNLTYNRFLDLQKAEAQARESQIQLAMERVRARTMAMQKSEELQDAARIMFQQIQTLGAPSWGCGYNIWDEDKKATTTWNSGKDGIHSSFKVPSNKDVFLRFYEADQREEDFYVEEMGGKELEAHYQYLSTIPELVANFKNWEASGIKLPTFQIFHIAYFSYGYLMFITYEPVPEMWDVFKRFAKVFEQTYTRFLDLQKAEAQARESQIQLAMERVRARTMAMQKSDELAKAAQLLYEEFRTLNINTFLCGYCFYKEEQDKQTVWVTLPDGTIIPDFVDFPITGDDVLNKRYQDWKQKKPLHVLELQGEKNKEHHRFLSSKVSDQTANEIFAQIPDRIILYCANFSTGYLFIIATKFLTSEEEDVIIRFARVFEVTYTRFSDLKQAELQTREAQIQLAMERVRARTMAMQRSEELADVATVLFQQVKALGVPQWTCGFNIWELGDKEYTFYPGSPDGDILPPCKVPLTEHWVFSKMDESRKRGEEFYMYEKEGEKQEEHYRYMLSVPNGLGELLQNMLDAGLQIPTFQIDHFANFSHGNLMFITYEHFPEMHDIFKRFAKVFEQTYTRFLDLQKAEAQAREAKIEAALEKVRSRSLAMHKSDELQEVVNTVFEKLKELDIEMDSANIAIFKEGTRDYDYWIASPVQKRSASFHMPYIDLSMTRDLIAARESGKDFSITAYSFEQKNEWFEYNFKNTDFKFLSENRKQFILNAPAITVAIAFSKHTGVQVNRYNSKLLTEGEAEILKRFSKVFEQAYIRFLDLEKAEAQSRESQIEAALERVRSRTMAMQRSDELANVATVLFQQVKALGVPQWVCGFSIWEIGDKEFTWYPGSPDGEILAPCKIPLTEHPVFISFDESRRRGDELFVYEKEGEFQADHYRYMMSLPGMRELLQNMLDAGLQFPTFQIDHLANFSHGNLAFITYEHFPEMHDIFKRFAKVFEQTYTRFLDLQKAEANAREAQIEAGLERVRARTMAMHNSDDVSAATATMFTELEKLGIENFRGGIANIMTNRTQDVWSVNNLTEARLPDGQGKTVKAVGSFNIDDHSFWQLMYKEWEDKKEFLYYFLAGKDKENYVKILSGTQNYLPQSLQQFPDVHFQVYFFGEGAIWTNSLQLHSEEAQQVMKKFTSVFSLTFRRYQDLKKAEAQTRQAQIETAMEKVRARALAMQKPEELIEVAQVLRKEMAVLGVEELETSSIYLHDEASANTECWYAIKKIQDDEKKLVTDHMIINLQDTWVGRQMLEFYNSDKTQISIPMQGENRKEWIYYCTEHSKAFDGFYGDNIPDRTYHLNKFSNGYIGAASPADISAESWDLLQRATSVFSLAYTRFSDLQIAEASTKEAVRRASLDRVRAEIASMRTMNDLQKITPLIWNELTILNIPFIRCGVFIMDASQQLIHTFLSTPDGKAIGAFHLPYDTPGNIRLVLKNWQDKKNYIDHWDKEAFIEFADTLIKQGVLTSTDQYLSTIPHGGFHLHFLPFLQGMLYVGNTTQLGEDEIKLIQSVADAFSTAYARYEDFNKLELAKEQIENTLTNLKQAQAQLIQSEKMASLGELTAGIAHEIQNPLNFVNNFSDVSTELVDEMNEEIAKGNLDDARQIAEDLKQNLEKINHHGKRAGDIVKGMLQHSRSSSATKEPTDINKLADEYLRLAYHGLRAKDKTFNATMKTEFDESIGNINVIPQDIGRVILNLITNAFYVVAEKKKQNRNGFEPTVSISTKKSNDKIEVSVKDNGSGIPQKVLDKIFQPFFTTKPTGQGTGLGLSLSYDIVKAHGGEIKVNTKENEGTEFIIQLPVKEN